MARGLARAGMTVDIATTDDNGPDHLSVPLEQPVVGDGYTVWYFPRQSRFYTFSGPLTSWLAQHSRDYEVVHIHAVFSYAALPAAIFARLAGVPYIVRPLGVLNRWGMQNRRPWLKRLSFNLIERQLLAWAALIHFTSEQEKTEAAELGLSTPSIVLPLGIDVPELNRAGVPADWYTKRFPALAGRTILLFLSRIDPKKGLDLLLEAFAEAHRQQPHLALVLAGEGAADFVGKLQAQVERLQLAADVVWAGFIAGSDKAAALAGADVFVLPSYSENYGIAVVEAMAAGVPVVISDQVGLSSDVGDAQAGLVVPCEMTPLTQALMELGQDSDRRKYMGQQGRALVQERFSTTVATQRLIEVYNQLAQHSGTPIEAAATLG